jgi:hypothetical protein
MKRLSNHWISKQELKIHLDSWENHSVFRKKMQQFGKVPGLLHCSIRFVLPLNMQEKSVF